MKKFYQHVTCNVMFQITKMESNVTVKNFVTLVMSTRPDSWFTRLKSPLSGQVKTVIAHMKELDFSSLGQPSVFLCCCLMVGKHILGNDNT